MKPNEVTEEMLTAFDAVLNLHDRIPDAIAAAINAMQKPQNDANKTLRDLSARMAMSGHERIDRNGTYRTSYDEGYSDAMFRAASWVDAALTAKEE